MILTLILSSVLVIGSPKESVTSEVVVPVAEDVALLIFEAEPCERISEIAKELRSDNWAVYRVDVNSNSNLARQCQVWETPHLVMFIKGHAWQQMSGCQSVQVLRSWFQEAAAESDGTRIKPSAGRIDNPFAELRTANLEKEYAAPIPDSLAGYDVHELSGGVRIVLEKPVAEEMLARLDGPSWSWGHAGCLMCLANSLVGVGYDATYLRGLTHSQWPTLWDNYHNGDPDQMKDKPRGQGYIGYGETGGYSTSGRRRGLGIFRRWRR